MKKSLLCALLWLLCSAMSFAQGAGDWRIHPDKAEYKIEGYFETTFTADCQVSYELTNVKPTGLSFPILSKYIGGHTKGGNVYFTFDHVKSAGTPDLDNIALWTYDEILGKWVADVETGKEEGNVQSTKEMTVMLVLDCSSSLMRNGSNGLDDVKNSAKSFIDRLYESRVGNIHIGIIGFSSMRETQSLSIQPLNYYSSLEMKSFIDSFKQGNGTALYKSFDDAIDLTQEYVKTLEKFAGAAIVTFTDGLDNGSNNFEKRIGSKQAYFKYIQDEVLSTLIGGYPFQSYTIFVPGGNDVKDPAVERKIIGELKTLAKQDGHFFYVQNMSDLNSKFGEIAKSLIDSWKVVSCFISAGQNGKVCWAFGKEVRPIKKENPYLIGVDLGVGIPIYDEYADAGLDFQLGLDFAYPLTNKFALGCYMSAGGGFCLCMDGLYKFSAGILMELGDLHDRPFLLGFGPCLGYGYTDWPEFLPFEFRFGRVFSNNWYMMGEIVCGVPFYGDYYIEPAIRIGYNFGHKTYSRKR